MSGGRTLGPGKLIKTKRGTGEALWVLDWRGSDGVRRRQALSPDKRLAERMRAELVHKRDLELAGLGSIEGQSKRLNELRDAYVEDLRSRVTANHLRNVVTRIDRVIAALRNPRVRDVRAQDLLAMRARRVAKGAGHQTLNHEIGNFRALLLWAVKHGIIGQCPIPSITPLPTDRGHIRRQRRAMSAEEVERFLQAAQDDDRAVEARLAAVRTITNGTKSAAWNARARNAARVPQAPLWRALVETGARYGELTRTEWADVDIARRLVTLRGETTKNGRLRVLPVRQELVEELLALRAIHEHVLERPLAANDRVFLMPEGLAWRKDSKNALRIFWRVLARAKIDRRDTQNRVLDLHALRHTCASLLARAGVPITTTQRILGHSTIELTSRYYTHVEVEDLHAALERVHGTKAARARAG